MLKDLQASVKDAWWLVVIMGVASIIFGAVALFVPGLALATLIVMFAALLFVEGVVETVYGLSAVRKDTSWWLSVLLGVLLLGVSVYLIRNPALTAAVFTLVVGWALVFRGLLEMAFGASLSKGKVHEVFLGLFSVAAGVVILLFPAIGTLALTWALGLYALMNGVVMFAAALSVRAGYRAMVSNYGV